MGNSSIEDKDTASRRPRIPRIFHVSGKIGFVRATLLTRGTLAILGILLALPLMAGPGYAIATTRAASAPTSQRDAPSFTVADVTPLPDQAASTPPTQVELHVVEGMGTPADGAALIAVDQERNLICVKSRHGRSMGGSCTRIDAPNPMTSITGGSPTDPIHITVVDPQRRLGVVRATAGGQQYAATSPDGLSVQLDLPRPADVLTILDANGNVLDASHPSTTINQANQAAHDLSTTSP